MVSIPDSVFDTYREFADDFISSNFGINCRIVYPPKREECPNCILDTVGQKSSNRYKSGGPISFTFGICPLCNGVGYKETEYSEVIKLRCYEDPKSWVAVPFAVNIPNGAIQIIGFIYDLPKIKRSIEIHSNIDQEAYTKWNFSTKVEPMAWGFKKNRYFVAFLERS